MLLFKLLERSLSLVSTVVLARLLLPSDFGLVAMATVIIAFLELMQAFGFDMALIQNQAAERKHYDTVWTFKVVFGLGMAVGMAALAYPAAQFYHEPRIIPVMLVLGGGLFIQGFENVGIIAFRKELSFDREFRFMFARKLGSFLVTVAAAYYLRSYWALILGIVFGNTLGVVYSYQLHPYRPRFTLAAASELFGFSKWILINNGLSFFYRRSSTLLIGRLGGAESLGIFTLGSEIGAMPTAELIAPINRAVFPGYAKLASNVAKLREAYLKVTGLIILIAIPAAVGLSVIAEPLVLTLLGEKWRAASPIIALLAMASAIRVFQTNTYYVHLSLDTVKRFVRVTAISTALLLPTLAICTYRWGVLGAAWAYLLVTLCTAPLYSSAVRAVLRLKFMPLVNLAWRPLLASGVMYIAVNWLSNLGKTGVGGDLPGLLQLVVFGALTYIPVLGMLWIISGRPAGPEDHVLQTLRPQVARSVATRLGLPY